MQDALFPAPVEEPKVKKAKEKPSPEVHQVIDAYEEWFKQRHDITPMRGQYGRFGRELKPMLAQWGLEVVLSLVREFCFSHHPKVMNTDWKPMEFIRLAQWLYLHRDGANNSVAAANLEVARRVTGRAHASGTVRSDRSGGGRLSRRLSGDHPGGSGEAVIPMASVSQRDEETGAG